VRQRRSKAAVAAIAVGFGLFKKAHAINKKHRQRLEGVQSFQQEGNALRDRGLAATEGQALLLKTEAVLWQGTVQQWLDEDIPTLAPQFRTRGPNLARYDRFGLIVNDFLGDMHGDLSALDQIMRALIQQGPGG